MDVIYSLAPLATEEEKMPTLTMTTYHGCSCYVRKIDDKHAQIVQVLTTRLSDQLRQDLYPGKIIKS